MAGRGERGPDIASTIRGAFIRAVKAREDNKPDSKKPPLSTVMDKLIDENPIGLLNAIKGFVPKEIDLTATERPYEDWLDKIAEDEKG